MKPTTNEIGAAIRRARLACGMSQDELAAAAGIAKSYVSMIELGKKVAQLGTLEKILKALGLRIAIVADDDELVHHAIAPVTMRHPHSVWIQKHSATTYVADVKSPTLPPELRDALDRSNVGKLWRARLGRDGRWHYGWSARDAVQAALDALDAALA